MNPKKRVIINASMVDEKPTGVGMVAINIINRLLVEESLNVTVLCPTDIHFGKPNVIKTSKFMLANRYGKLAAFYRFFWNQLIYPFYAKKYDIAYSPTTHGSIFLTNQVITIHDLISFQFPDTHKLQRLYFKLALPFFLKRGKAVITISEEVKNSIIRYFPKVPSAKINVIYNGYNRAIFKKQPATKINQQKYILAVGPTYAHKNFESIIAAYAKLPELLQQNYPLYVVSGREPYLSTIKSLVEKNKLTDQVKFLNYITNEELSTYYNNSTALIYLSLYEGFGLPPIEAMACGCPVIASNASSIPEICGNAACVVNPVDINEVVEKLEQMLTSAEIREYYRSLGFERVKMFSWDDAHRKIVSLFNTL